MYDIFTLNCHFLLSIYQYYIFVPYLRRLQVLGVLIHCMQYAVCSVWCIVYNVYKDVLITRMYIIHGRYTLYGNTTYTGEKYIHSSYIYGRRAYVRTSYASKTLKYMYYTGVKIIR